MSEGPHYLLTATIHCRATNGRRIPWSKPIMDALIASKLIKHGWEKTSNSTMALRIPVEGADPATAEEGFIGELRSLEATEATKGVGQLKATFTCNTVTVFDRKDKLPPLATIVTRTRAAKID